jgi:hypothetical protein
MGAYPLQALTQGGVTQGIRRSMAFGRALLFWWRELWERMNTVGGHWLASLSANAWIAVNAIDEGKICYKGRQRIH